MKISGKNYGFIGWYQDESDNVFDRSELVLGDSVYDVPGEYGIYMLTEKGLDIYEKWCDDAFCGYSLGSGKAKGLADKIGGTERCIWKYLTNDETLSIRIA